LQLGKHFLLLSVIGQSHDAFVETRGRQQFVTDLSLNINQSIANTVDVVFHVHFAAKEIVLRKEVKMETLPVLGTTK
jgi:hypothetical protein